jgi:LysM repeat protein
MTTLTRVQTQRKQDMIFESKIRREPIYESVYASTRYLVEADLTQDQIKQVFQTVSDNLAGDKSNRTALGKGADVVSKGAAAVGGAWNKVKSAISTSGPVSGFDVTIDKLQTGIMDKLGGKGGKVANTLTAYREFAKKHPIMQGAVYAIFVAAAAVATGGGALAIGAIAGGLKLADRLLQGDKASSAIWKGFKAGAIGAAAAGIAGMLQGGDTAADAAANAKAAATGSKVSGAENLAGAKASGAENLAGAKASGAKAAAAGLKSDLIQYAVKQGDTLSDIAQRANTSVDLLMKANPQITNPDVIKAGMKISVPDVFGSVYDKGVGTAADTAAKLARGVYRENRYVDLTKTAKFRQLAESRGYEVSTVYFTQAGVNRIFENVITEGMWDRLKGAVKSGISSATNKVTFDKLDMNWRRGGNPAEGSVDSEKIKEFLRSQGVKDDVIDAAMSKILGSSTPAAPTEPSAKITDISPKTKRYLDALVSRIDVEPDRAAKQADVKKIVNAIRSSGDPAEFRFVIPKVVDIINQNEYDLTPDWAQKAIKAVKAGKLIERSMFRTLTGMLGEAVLTWSEVGYRPLLSESVKGHVVLQKI